MHNWHISSWFYEWSDGMQRICSHIGKNIYQTEFTCGLRLVCTANKKTPLRFIWCKKTVVNIAFHEDWVLDNGWIELGVFWLDLIFSSPCPFTCAFCLLQLLASFPLLEFLPLQANSDQLFWFPFQSFSNLGASLFLVFVVLVCLYCWVI